MRSEMGSYCEEDKFPVKLRDLSWRLDVAISSSSIAKVMEPQINLDMALDDGERKEFSLTQDKFHQLRFSVASILKQMEMLEKKKVFRNHDGK